MRIYLKFLSYLGLDKRIKTKHNPGKPNFGSGPSLQGLSARGLTCKGLPVRALSGCWEGSGYSIMCILHVYDKICMYVNIKIYTHLYCVKIIHGLHNDMSQSSNISVEDSGPDRHYFVCLLSLSTQKSTLNSILTANP